jgi:hypothetical protein
VEESIGLSMGIHNFDPPAHKHVHTLARSSRTEHELSSRPVHPSAKTGDFGHSCFAQAGIHLVKPPLNLRMLGSLFDVVTVRHQTFDCVLLIEP